MPVKNKPNTKDKVFVKRYIKNKFNGAKTAIEVLDAKPELASQTAAQKLRHPVIQNEIQRQLAEAGLTPEYINKTMYEAIEINKEGKPSQAVLAQLLIQAQKIYSYMPKDSKTVIKQERKVLLAEDLTVLKNELTQSVTTTQELLQDLG